MKLPMNQGIDGLDLQAVKVWNIPLPQFIAFIVQLWLDSGSDEIFEFHVEKHKKLFVIYL